MRANLDHKKSGIYCIYNMINQKKYIGKSKNIHTRIKQHIAQLNHSSKDENPYLIRSWKKYGRENFNYFVVEFLELNEDVLKTRELYWMETFNTLDKRFGYNLRKDSSSGLVVQESTSLKISARLKKEWSSGIRKNHSIKLAANWKDNLDRKIEQSKIMTKNLTKYTYKIYTLDNVLIEQCDYRRLQELCLQNVLATFHKKKLSKVKFKDYVIERLIIENIVRHSEKSEITVK